MINGRFLATALLLVSVRARAQVDGNIERARSHVKAAIAYYDEGRYEDSAREMETAYRLKPLADLQYNLAQCYERLNRLQDAVDAYRRYVVAKPSAEDHDEIVTRVKNLEERIGREKAGIKDSAPPTTIYKEVLKTVVVYREAPPKPGRSARYVALGLGVIALGAVAAGAAFAVLAKQNADAVAGGGNPTSPMPFTGSPAESQAAGRTDQIVSWVSFGVAALAAGGAVGLYFLGRHIDREAAKQLALVPSFGPSGGGLALAGGF